MGTDRVKKIAGDAAVFAAEALKEGIQNRENDIRMEEYKEASQRQKDRDIKSAVRAFLDLKASDTQIMQLLSKYFEIDSIDKASEIIVGAKKTRQIIALREYCVDQQGIMSVREFREYADGVGLEERLLNDQKLLELTPEKLKKILDK